MRERPRSPAATIPSEATTGQAKLCPSPTHTPSCSTTVTSTRGGPSSECLSPLLRWGSSRLPHQPIRSSHPYIGWGRRWKAMHLSLDDAEQQPPSQMHAPTQAISCVLRCEGLDSLRPRAPCSTGLRASPQPLEETRGAWSRVYRAFPA